MGALHKLYVPEEGNVLSESSQHVHALDLVPSLLGVYPKEML